MSLEKFPRPIIFMIDYDLAWLPIAIQFKAEEKYHLVDIC